MRKMLALCFAAAIFVLLFAAPAMAQTRDPFQPVIDTSGGGATSGEAPTTAGEGEVVVPQDPGGLANTGVDTDPWLVIAYVLISVGAAVVVLSKTLAPTPIRSTKTRA